MQEAHQVLEGVQAQAVIPVVGQVRHEDADLFQEGGEAGAGQPLSHRHQLPTFWSCFSLKGHSMTSPGFTGALHNLAV